MHLLCDCAFKELKLQQIDFLIEPTNIASCVTAEKLGAVRDGLPLGSDIIHGTTRKSARFVLTPDMLIDHRNRWV